jgi:SHS2 domain-containing protein
MKFKYLPHTADIKFQAFGKTLSEAFKNSALALTNIVYDGKVISKKEIKIKVKGKDIENLLYEFLEEFLVLIDSKDFILSKIKNFKINLKKGNLKIEATLLGDNIEKYESDMHIKAITYHEMFVRKIKDKFVTQIIVDI